MKLIASGVTKSAASTRSPSFSRSSSSTRITILPARMSAMISVVGLTAMLCALILEFAQPLGVTRERIDFDIDFRCNRQRVQVGRSQRVRDEVDLETRAFHRVDRQAYAVHRDRTFSRNIF